MEGMLWLLPIFAAGTVLYALLGYIFSGRSVIKEKNKQKETEEAYKREIDLRDARIGKLQEELNSAKSETEKIKSECAQLKQDLELAAKKEAELKELAANKEKWFSKEEEIVKKTQTQMQELKAKLSAKEKETQEGFTKNVSLERELRAASENIQALEKEKKSLSEEIKNLQVQTERLNKGLLERQGEIKTHQDTIAAMKKKQEESEWVPKEEFNKLKIAAEALKRQLAQAAQAQIELPPPQAEKPAEETKPEAVPEEKILKLIEEEKPKEEKPPEEKAE